MILALDPGIDATGWAVVRVRDQVLTPQQSVGLLVGSGTLRTKASQPLLDRLGSLADQLVRLVRDHPGVQLIVLERPSHAGTYRQHASRPDLRNASETISIGLAPMHMATGALALQALQIMGTIGGAVEFVAASGSHKSDRTTILRSIFPQLDKSNQDQRDAVWLALAVLTDGRRRWPEGAHANRG